MKIKVFSDIHLEFYSAYQVFDAGKGDILILAGDIMTVRHLKKDGYLGRLYRDFLNNCAKDFSHVLYVLGNHCFYGYNYEGTFRTLRESVPSNVQILDNDCVKIGDMNFIGFTFWTDFRNENALDMMEARSVMNDYRCIRIGSNYRKMIPEDTLRFHKRSKEFLLEKLKELKDEKVFVISHHSPTLQSIPEEFKTSLCNSAYCSDLDDLILSYPNIKYWVYGHTHNAKDFYIGETRLINNAVGYPGQDTGYNPNLFLKI